MEKSIFEIELKTLEENLERLKKENPVGGYVVIKGKEILGVWESRADALKEGLKVYGNIPFLVKNINDINKILNFSRNLFSELCHS
jgi:hypothetical protein